MATERDLAQLCHQSYGPRVSYALWIGAEIAIAACDLAEVIGSAIALELLFHIPLFYGVLITGFDVLLILLLQRWGFRYVEALVIALIGTIIGLFGVQMFLSRPEYWLALHDLVIPSPSIVTNPAMLYIGIGILGATVMPHNLYLHLSLIHISDGIITRKSVELDQNVSAGQNLLTLVSLQDIWVTANFKETQLKHMQPQQTVEVHVDATGRNYKGRVTQIGGATGSVLSLFPPENATGNYVKVVQRLPVRIDFTDLQNEDPNHQLRPGLSVEPKVTVK